MTTRQKLDPDFLRVLNENLKESPVWQTLMNKTTEVINQVVHEQITELARSREAIHVHRGDYLTTPLGRGRVVHVDRKYDTTNVLLDEITVYVNDVGNVVVPFRAVQQRDVLVDGARLLGFDYFSDSLTDEDYARIYSYIGQYWDSSAGVNFINFLGFIKNLRFEINQLWTEDSGDFAETETDYPWLEVNNGGFSAIYGSNAHPDLDAQTTLTNMDYPTSHVEIVYDIDMLESTNGVLSDDDYNDVVSLFYFLAPIHLVLERICSSVNLVVETYSSGGKYPQASNYEMSFYNFGHAVSVPTVSLKSSSANAFDGVHQAYLYLNTDFDFAP